MEERAREMRPIPGNEPGPLKNELLRKIVRGSPVLRNEPGGLSPYVRVWIIGCHGKNLKYERIQGRSDVDRSSNGRLPKRSIRRGVGPVDMCHRLALRSAEQAHRSQRGTSNPPIRLPGAPQKYRNTRQGIRSEVSHISHCKNCLGTSSFRRNLTQCKPTQGTHRTIAQIRKRHCRPSPRHSIRTRGYLHQTRNRSLCTWAKDGEAGRRVQNLIEIFVAIKTRRVRTPNPGGMPGVKVADLALPVWKLVAQPPQQIGNCVRSNRLHCLRTLLRMFASRCKPLTQLFPLVLRLLGTRPHRHGNENNNGKRNESNDQSLFLACRLCCAPAFHSASLNRKSKIEIRKSLQVHLS